MHIETEARVGAFRVSRGCRPRTLTLLLALPLAACSSSVDPISIRGSRYAHLVQSDPGLLFYDRFSEGEATPTTDRQGGLVVPLNVRATLGSRGPIEGDPEMGALCLDAFEGVHLHAPLGVALTPTDALTVELWAKPRGRYNGTQCVQKSQYWTKLLWVSGTVIPGLGAYGLEFASDDLTKFSFHLQVDPDGALASPAQALTAIPASGGQLSQGTGGAACEDASWHYLAATYDAALPTGNLRLFADGVEVFGSYFTSDDFGTLSPVPDAAAARSAPGGGIAGYDLGGELSIGGVKQQPGDAIEWGAFDGCLDEVAIYRTALSPAQIRNHYRVGKGGVPLE